MRIPTRPAALLLAAVIPTLFLATGASVKADDNAATLAKVLEQARAAMGGQALAKLTGLAAEGEFRRLFGQRETNGDLEMKLSGGDKMLWTESMSPTGDPTMRFVRTTGLNGTVTLESFSGAGGRFGGQNGPGGAGAPGGAPGAQGGRPPAGPDDTPEARQARQLRAQQRQAARIMLALLLKQDGPLPLEFAYGGEADSDDGKADVIVVTGADNFQAQVFIDQKTHLPLVLGYRDVQQRMGGGMRGPGGPGGPGGQAPQAGQPAPSREEMEQRMREARERARTEPPVVVDVQWFMSDHKKVNGVMLPHTVRRTENGEVREEWTFKKFTVNPTFKPDTFEKK